MKTRLSLIALVLSLLATAARADDAKTVKVFLLGGQSNMVGSGRIADLKTPYDKPYEGATFWNARQKTWEPVTPGKTGGGGRFGPEISFAQAIKAAMPDDDVRLVKYAAGGTALYNDWSPQSKGRQYVQFMATAKSAIENLDRGGTKYEIVGMLWLQGESDAQERQAESYEKNLRNFIAHMREQFKTPKMQFVIARVRNHYGGKTGQAKIVRDAQSKIADTSEGVEWFDTDDCTMVNAGHYDSNGLIEIGKRFAEKIQTGKE